MRALHLQDLATDETSAHRMPDRERLCPAFRRGFVVRRATGTRLAELELSPLDGPAYRICIAGRGSSYRVGARSVVALRKRSFIARAGITLDAGCDVVRKA